MMIVNVKPRTRSIRFYHPNFDRTLNEFFHNELPATNDDTPKNSPAVNVLETAENFKIEVAAPGFGKADFSVNAEKNVLTIAAKKEVTEEANITLRRKEFGLNEFERTFQLPETVNVEGIEAVYNNGILLVTLPKVVETTITKKIEIA